MVNVDIKVSDATKAAIRASFTNPSKQAFPLKECISLMKHTIRLGYLGSTNKIETKNNPTGGFSGIYQNFANTKATLEEGNYSDPLVKRTFYFFTLGVGNCEALSRTLAYFLIKNKVNKELELTFLEYPSTDVRHSANTVIKLGDFILDPWKQTIDTVTGFIKSLTPYQRQNIPERTIHEDKFVEDVEKITNDDDFYIKTLSDLDASLEQRPFYATTNHKDSHDCAIFVDQGMKYLNDAFKATFSEQYENFDKKDLFKIRFRILFDFHYLMDLMKEEKLEKNKININEMLNKIDVPELKALVNTFKIPGKNDRNKQWEKLFLEIGKQPSQTPMQVDLLAMYALLLGALDQDKEFKTTDMLILIGGSLSSANEEESHEEQKSTEFSLTS